MPKTKHTARRFKIYFILALISFCIGCDQVSKTVVRKHITPTQEISVFEKYITFTKVENKGMAMGMGAKLPELSRFFFVVLFPILVLLFITILVLKSDIDKITLGGFAFIIGGGIGNIIDRIAFGSVTDFVIIDLGFYQTGIFNVADIAVCIGALTVLGYGLINSSRNLVFK